MPIKSGAGDFNATDFVKTLQAFVYHAVSLSAALVIAILALPANQLPDWLGWLVPCSAFINAVAYGFIRWQQDNR